MAERPAPLLLSADIPYASLPRDAWPAAVARARRSGANAVVARVGWAWHAPQPGVPDLHGNTDSRRDLAGLAEVCRALDTQLLVDLGGLRDLPPWLRRAAGARPGSQPDALHPAALPDAQRWLEAVAEALQPAGSEHRPATLVAEGLPAGLRAPLRAWRGPVVAGLMQPWQAAATPGPLTPLRAPDLLGRFRSDGSATLPLWETRPLLTLLGASPALAAAGPPPGEPPFAWADDPDVEVLVRHSGPETLLVVTSRRADTYSGVLTYRALDESLLHVHLSVGAGRRAAILVVSEEVAGAAFTGDASEGGWVARSMKSSVVFSGAAGVVPCGPGVLLTAGQSGRFQIRRPQGWDGLEAFRLYADGGLAPARRQVDAQHLIVPYVAEDERGQTDLYAVIPPDAPAPAPLHAHLAAALRARAAEVAALAGRGPAAEPLRAAARALHELAAGPIRPDDYRAAWDSAAAAVGRAGL